MIFMLKIQPDDFENFDLLWNVSTKLAQQEHDESYINNVVALKEKTDAEEESKFSNSDKENFSIKLNQLKNIKTSTVFNFFQFLLCLIPCKFSKILVVGKFFKKFILKILGLKINSRKIFLIFLFIRYDTTIIQLLF